MCRTCLYRNQMISFPYPIFSPMIHLLFFLLGFQQIDCKTIYATATFGRQGANCTGRGICSFTEEPLTSSGNVQLLYNSKEAMLEMKVMKSKISEEVLLRQFDFDYLSGKQTSDNGFVMEETFKISGSMMLKLGIPQWNNSIRQSQYKMSNTTEYFIVQFKMSTL